MMSDRDTRAGTTIGVRALFRSVVAAGLLLTSGWSTAEADNEYIVLDPTMVAVHAVAVGEIFIDALDADDWGGNLQIQISAAGASAHAAIGPPWGAWTRAQGFGEVGPAPQGGADASATIEYTVEDPLGRPTVRLNLHVRGAGVVAGAGGTAEWSVRVDDGLLITTLPDGSQAYAAAILDENLAVVGVLPPGMTDNALQVSGFTTTGSGVCDTFTGGGGCVHFDTQSTEFQAVVNFETAPGTKYVQLRAHAHRNAVAVADPVIEPHPDNPEVVVTMRGMTLPPIPGPFAGITPEDLLARGIDPGPFVRLGFFDPPAPTDSTPPSTLATPQPGPNASGWNNAPVTVDLAAADNAGGTGVKEIRWALSGASTGSQVVAGSNTAVVISGEGQTTLTYFAVDQANNQEAPKTLTVRIDRTPPLVAGLPAAGCILWPPSHRLVSVATLSASDWLSGLAAGSPTVTAVSSEPMVGPGDGTAPDIVVSGGAVHLRAERAGNGSGRTYTIKASATDLAGNEATATRTCTVPHDRGKP